MSIEFFIPFWGDPRHLYLTIESLRAQRDENWRATVLDDQYPDESVSEWFAELDEPRITYVRNPENLGITENYREAVRRTTADYVTILGCDDILHPAFLDVVRRTIAKVPQADVIQPGVDIIDGDGTPTNPLVDRVKQRLLAPQGQGIAVLQGERMATSLMRGDWLYWPSLTFRAETLRRIDFRDGLPITQDLALLMDIAFQGGTLAYNPEVVFSYRRHGASASQKTLLDGRRFRDERAYLATARGIALEHGWGATARAARLRIMSRLHGVAELPRVLRDGSAAGVQSNVAHIFAL